jgi:hypothetical protein
MAELTQGEIRGEIRGVMIPVTNARVLLPNATVAEVITFSTPEKIASTRPPDSKRRHCGFARAMWQRNNPEAESRKKGRCVASGPSGPLVTSVPSGWAWINACSTSTRVSVK